MDGCDGDLLYFMAGLNRGGNLLDTAQVNGTIKKIAIGVSVVVFAGLILAGVRGCRWMHDAVIRLEERSHK